MFSYMVEWIMMHIDWWMMTTIITFAGIYFLQINLNHGPWIIMIHVKFNLIQSTKFWNCNNCDIKSKECVIEDFWPLILGINQLHNF